MKILRNHLFFYVCSALFIVLLLSYFLASFLMEFWWYNTLDLSAYFIKRTIYRDVIVILAACLGAVLIYGNLALIPRLLSSEEYRTNPKSKPLYINKKSSIAITCILDLPIAFLAFSYWRELLMFLFSPKAGIQDPLYHTDISYYLFSFPVYSFIQNELIAVVFLVLLCCAFFYRRLYVAQKELIGAFPQAAKMHLSLLIVSLVLLSAWSISLQATELLYTESNEPVFFGPGALDMKYQLPIIWLTFISFCSFAGLALYYLYFGTKKSWLIVSFGIFLMVLGLRQINFIPDLIDRFFIQANPVLTEKKYIRAHMDATLQAFDLTRVKKISYPLHSALSKDIYTEVSEELFNIPLWDHHLLEEVYNQLQAIRPYYHFTPVTVDRYRFGGKEHQVNIAARELIYDKLPKAARNWENQHMKYTHGYGLAVTPASQQGNQPLQWLLREISLQTDVDKFRLANPQIFYGLAKYKYAVVPNKVPAAKHLESERTQDYQGSGGLPLASILHKLVVSAFLRDEKLFFSTSITSESKILVRRNIIERIKNIAPFLHLDANPYPVIIKNRIYWIVDAYTSSDRYPLVKPMTSPFLDDAEDDHADQLNYIRNPVKIIVDAYNGNVDFYITDPSDVIVRTYQRMFPSLFKPLAQIPDGFIKHLSYPQDLFALQMQIYSRFHPEHAEAFYQQSEALEMAKMHDKTIEPYYLTIDILEKPAIAQTEQEKFILVSPLSPINRDNLHSVAIGGCLESDDCSSQYAQDIYVYTFPASVQVDGPGQISALMHQNPEIARQFSLWGQRGSKTIKGRMFIIPVEKSILYIQPVYMAATSKTGFPQLVKVIIAMNQKTAMADSIEEAFLKLSQIDGKQFQTNQKVYNGLSSIKADEQLDTTSLE